PTCPSSRSPTWWASPSSPRSVTRYAGGSASHPASSATPRDCRSDTSFPLGGRRFSNQRSRSAAASNGPEGEEVTTTTTRPGALVTGAGRGLGRAIAGLLADRGYLVMVTDLSGEAATAAAAELGRGALRAEVDVRDRAQVERARDELIAAAG